MIFSVFFLDHVIFLRTGCFFFVFSPTIAWCDVAKKTIRNKFESVDWCTQLNPNVWIWTHICAAQVCVPFVWNTQSTNANLRDPKLSFIFLDFLSWRDDNFHVEPNGCVAFSVFALCLFHYGNWSDMLQFLDVTWPVVQPLMCMNIPLILYRCVWTLLGIVFCIVIHGYNVFAQFPAFQSMCAVAESRWFQQDVIVVAARRQ